MVSRISLRTAVTGFTLGLCGSVAIYGQTTYGQTTYGQTTERFIRQPKSKQPHQSSIDGLSTVHSENSQPPLLEIEANSPPTGAKESETPTPVLSHAEQPSLRFAPLVRTEVPSASNIPSSNRQNPRSLQWVSRSQVATASPAEMNSRPTTSNLPLAAARMNENYRSTVPPHDLAQLERYQQMEVRLKEVEAKLQEKIELEKMPTKAMLASSRILNDPKFSNSGELQPAPGRVETPQGWQSVGQRLSAHINNSESLLRRGAYCSARQEAENAIGMLLRHIDLVDNQFRCEPAWLQAQLALREAEDFSRTQHSLGDTEALQRLIASHETGVLKATNLEDISPLTAAQHYRAYAEKQLVHASQMHPWASELYYVVGRTFQSAADQDPARIDLLRANALSFYRAARQILPTNAVACNQLGYLLLQLDRPEEAREALVAAVELRSDEAFLSNLAEASRRLGDRATQEWATNAVAVIRANRPSQPVAPAVIEINPEEFKALSPMGVGPQVPQMIPAQPTAPVNGPPHSASLPQVAGWTGPFADPRMNNADPRVNSTAGYQNLSAGQMR